MADWLAPFSMPVFADKEFEAARAKYVAKHGYTLTFPGLSDILIYDVEKPMTPGEHMLWKHRLYDKIPPARRAEIRHYKQKRKNRFLAMLSSPSPNIARNIGSIMTSLDDAQDAISTLAIIGMLATKAVPRIVGKFLMGPVGWGMTAADAINVYAFLKCMLFYKDAGKRKTERLADCNPWGKKARARRARRMAGNIPIQGAIIEGLQTTGEVFGIGISLGPIVGLLQDILYTNIRIAQGKKVALRTPVHEFVEDVQEAWQATSTWKGYTELMARPNYSHWGTVTRKAAKMLNSLTLFWWFRHETVDEDMIIMYMAGLLAHQVMMPTLKQFNPLDEFEDLRYVEVRVPTPTNILTIEVIEEAGLSVEGCSNWPWNDQPWDSIESIADHVHRPAVDNLKRYIQSNEHNWFGYVAGTLATDTALYSLANWEGEENVRYDYTVPWKAISIMADANFVIPMGQPAEKIKLFAAWLEKLEADGESVSLPEIIQFCEWNEIAIIPAD